MSQPISAKSPLSPQQDAPSILGKRKTTNFERAARAKPSYLSDCGKGLVALYRSGQKRTEEVAQYAMQSSSSCSSKKPRSYSSLLRILTAVQKDLKEVQEGKKELAEIRNKLSKGIDHIKNIILSRQAKQFPTFEESSQETADESEEKLEKKYSPEEAAHILNKSTRIIYLALNKGRMQGSREGDAPHSKWWVTKESIRKFADQYLSDEAREQLKF